MFLDELANELILMYYNAENIINVLVEKWYFLTKLYKTEIQETLNLSKYVIEELSFQHG